MPANYTSHALRKVARDINPDGFSFVVLDSVVQETEPYPGFDARVRLLINAEVARILNEIADIREREEQ